MNVAELILSEGQDSAPAIFYKDAVVTYGELRRRVSDMASCFRGYEHGARVGILSENSPFFVTAYLGIMRAGLVVVPFQTDLAPETFQKIVASAGIKEVLVSRRLANRARPWAEGAGVRLVTEGERAQRTEGRGQGAEQGGQGVDALDAQISPLDLAALMFTSGSTGEPKGVMVSHRNIECNSRDIVSYMGLDSRDRVMVVLPFHYCFGLSLLHTHLMAGGSLVLNNDFRLYPETVLREMQDRECTGIAGVPSTYQLLLRKSRFRQMSFPKLRWFQQAGGKLPNACIEEIRSSFPQVRYFLMYGQTEGTARLSYLPPERLVDKLGSIGTGLPSTTLEVVKPDGTPVNPGSDGTGEIVARGDNIAQGYWNDAEETARYFRNGRLYTGDLARVDSDGFIYVVERERDMIKSGGNRISAKEIEDVIAEIPEVVEVAVVGTPHDLLGEAIRAFIVPTTTNGITPNSVLAHCRKRLPAFKNPEEIIFLRTMPHNSAGKILKRELKTWERSTMAPVHSRHEQAPTASALPMP